MVSSCALILHLRQIFGDDNGFDSDAERDLEGTAFYAIMAHQETHGESGSGSNDINNSTE